MSTASISHQPIYLLGFGGVGRALIRQIVDARDRHRQRRRLHLDVIGLADSTLAACAPEGLSDATLIHLVQHKQSGGRLADALPAQCVTYAPTDVQLLDRLPPHTIIVDTTATEATVPLLIQAKRRGLGVVLANKLPLAGELTWWDVIADDRSRWETTCGAALPVISTLNTLLDSGDDVQRIEGSLSGTLGFIASQLEAGVSFGAAVRDAKQRGFTEPDPRQDLGGLDAARKALILARMLGYRLTMAEVQVESLYPAEMDGLSVEAFLRAADALDRPIAQRAAALTHGGRKLRYAATIEHGRCVVGLVGVEPATKLGSIRSSDSIVVFHTRYFSDNPLAVSGRGAGQEVTASGVLGDIVALSGTR